MKNAVAIKSYTIIHFSPTSIHKTKNAATFFHDQQEGAN